jgi:predicted nuclease with TOPRIM domain
MSDNGTLRDHLEDMTIERNELLREREELKKRLEELNKIVFKLNHNLAALWKVD